MTCHWCGDDHRSDQLCQRAQRGLTRRSFFGLFGAGVAGVVVASALPWPIAPPPIAVMSVPVYNEAGALGAVVARKLYRSNASGTVFKLIATINDNTTRTYTDNMTGIVLDNLPIIGDGVPERIL
jgi:hypothetical protein